MSNSKKPDTRVSHSWDPQAAPRSRTCALFVHSTPARSTITVSPKTRSGTTITSRSATGSKPWSFKKGDKLIAKRPRTVQYPLIKIKEPIPESDSDMCWGRNARFPLKRQFVEDNYQINLPEL